MLGHYRLSNEEKLPKKPLKQGKGKKIHKPLDEFMNTRHKSEFPPLLQQGLHDLDEKSLKALVVEKFPRSTRREILWNNFVEIVGQLKSLKLPCKIWLDGSFLTEKIDPDDIDLVVDFPIQVMLSLSPEQGDIIHKLSNCGFRHNQKLHTFVMFTAPAIHVEYVHHVAVHEQWKRDFGFSYIKREPKGIAVLEVRP